MTHLFKWQTRWNGRYIGIGSNFIVIFTPCRAHGRAAAQGEHQRAHSRRHVIIVSVVVQWCGADLHSEGHGEQQGRREVRQTHTESTPHEERAAARHAPYAAHHARHTLQSTAAGTHTHTALPQHQHTDGRGRSKQERHTRLQRMYIRRERSVVSAPLTEGAHTHKKVQRTQQHKSKVTIQKEIPAHHVDCWSTGSAANIHHKAACYPVLVVCCYNNE
ncbi:hypothetical protein ECC02_012295 [Trypanosoma cruzi]|uniref:Uncharacterized protein n=1 Tax=Trypanosoma cruzi TaxID=5693 RepID=A0A7J6XLC8_TRYCR|nr:hypothetical protein ECC02_012295 [Trypanosoma cruzi]